MQPPLLPVLDAVERLLHEQALAVRGGDADALPSLNDRVRQGLALLARSVGQQPLPASVAQRIAALQARAASTMSMLARRQNDVDQSLRTLGANHAGLQDMQARSVYAAQGGMASGGWRSRSFERA